LVASSFFMRIPKPQCHLAAYPLVKRLSRNARATHEIHPFAPDFGMNIAAEHSFALPAGRLTIVGHFTNKGRKNTMNETKGRGRGFASMDRDKQRQIASKGGRAAHATGTAHEWTSEEARAAGRKGGIATRKRITAG
jgi:general stress protein YciG